MANNYIKDAPHHMLSGKCKLRQRDPPAHLLERPKSRTPNNPMLVRTRSHRNVGSWLVGKRNGAATLEDSLESSYKIKHALATWSWSHTPCRLPKGDENLGPHDSLHTGVHSGFTQSPQTLEQPRCPSAGERTTCGPSRQRDVGRH